MWDRYFNLLDVAEKNRTLTERIERLEAERAAFDEQLKENDRLRRLLNLGSITELQGVAASVIANEPSGWIKVIVVNKGRSQGVHEGMAVVHPRGVVGQVVSSSSNFSRVLLLTDHASGVDALVQDNRARGIVEGAGASAAILNYVAKEYPVRVGDVVVTSGMDGVFPKGIIIGSVSQVGVESGTLLQNIAVKPAVDFSRLEEVLIVTANQERKAEAAAITEPPARRSKEGK
jgi:rod shape-determining protein MreC